MFQNESDEGDKFEGDEIKGNIHVSDRFEGDYDDKHFADPK